ncbi:MAG: tRNA pseudouridine(55) synthase TruB [Chloroflexota bacterium]|nr:tRNA pseudouridine(55) synthase TruB [Chloroflexota bacterium]
MSEGRFGVRGSGFEDGRTPDAFSELRTPNSELPTLSGILVVDKPAGWTAHDVVARVRRLTGVRRVGHAGTLDPAATGVLPVCVGEATKVVEYLSAHGKVYLAAVLLGATTDTDDLDGWVIEEGDTSHISLEMVRKQLPQFVGEITQVPPAYSAIHIGGQRAYALARAGQVVDVPARQVTVHRLTLVAWAAPVVWLVVDCGAGTYIRALARDLGVALGCGATLARLVRLRSGPFRLCEAWSLDELAALPDLHAAWSQVAVHPDATLADWPALLLDDRAARDWSQGKAIADIAAREGTHIRAYDAVGEWRGVGVGADGAWRPKKVVTSTEY